MKSNHKINVENFIKELKKFDTKNLSRAKYIFNPWTTSDESDINKNAHIIRCSNLENYLLNIENPDYILIAESPSKGARYTGIAMTSEKSIKEYKLPFQYTSKNYKKYKRGESTATKVWREIKKSDACWKNFVFWNAFAFNIHKDAGKWFENPLPDELEKNKNILESFINIYPNAKIIAIGNNAKMALNSLGKMNIEYIRHPSNDYAKRGEGKTFPEQISKFL